MKLLFCYYDEFDRDKIRLCSYRKIDLGDCLTVKAGCNRAQIMISEAPIFQPHLYAVFDGVCNVAGSICDEKGNRLALLRVNHDRSYYWC